MKTVFALVFCAVALFGLGTWRIAERDEAMRAAADTPRAAGKYEIDSATGEITARHTDRDGVTTTMRSGAKVAPVLPAGFTPYPGSLITNTTRVDQPDGAMVLLNFESADPVSDLLGFYRRQAQVAGIAVDMDLRTDAMNMIGGSARDGTSFSFTATRTGELTTAQLSVGRGFN